MDYDMGFRSVGRPMSDRERYEELVEQFLESGEDCIGRECEIEREAKSVQAALSKVAKASGCRCTHRGRNVYLMRYDG